MYCVTAHVIEHFESISPFNCENESVSNFGEGQACL